LVTSVDNDGVQCGFDAELAEVVAAASTLPVVIGGGCGGIDDVLEMAKIERLSGLALASALHFNIVLLEELKAKMKQQNQKSLVEGDLA